MFFIFYCLWCLFCALELSSGQRLNPLKWPWPGGSSGYSASHPAHPKVGVRCLVSAHTWVVGSVPHRGVDGRQLTHASLSKINKRIFKRKPLQIGRMLMTHCFAPVTRCRGGACLVPPRLQAPWSVARPGRLHIGARQPQGAWPTAAPGQGHGPQEAS